MKRTIGKSISSPISIQFLIIYTLFHNGGQLIIHTSTSGGNCKISSALAALVLKSADIHPKMTGRVVCSLPSEVPETYNVDSVQKHGEPVNTQNIPFFIKWCRISEPSTGWYMSSNSIHLQQKFTLVESVLRIPYETR